jgi:hypothetical protein
LHFRRLTASKMSNPVQAEGVAQGQNILDCFVPRNDGLTNSSVLDCFVTRNDGLTNSSVLDCFVPRNDGSVNVVVIHSPVIANAVKQSRRKTPTNSPVCLSFSTPNGVEQLRSSDREDVFLPRAVLRLHGVIHTECLPALLKLTTLTLFLVACLPVACCLLLAAYSLRPFIPSPFTISPPRGLPACCLLLVACCLLPTAIFLPPKKTSPRSW